MHTNNKLQQRKQLPLKKRLSKFEQFLPKSGSQFFSAYWFPRRLGLCLCLGMVVLSQSVVASVISFSSSDVVITDTPVGNVQFWEFEIDLAGSPVLGVNANPAINEVDYAVSGSLDAGNPSGFGSFNLLSEHINAPSLTPLTGAQYYGNGGSLDFIVNAGANLLDGLQVSELDLLPSQGYPLPVDDSNAVFVLNAREDGTGRYHPPIVILRNDGTGQIMNSNNTGVNGQTNRDIVADDGLTYGNEYITNFTFNANLFTVAAPVPIPGAFVLYACGLFGMACFAGRRRV